MSRLKRNIILIISIALQVLLVLFMNLNIANFENLNYSLILPSVLLLGYLINQK